MKILIAVDGSEYPKTGSGGQADVVNRVLGRVATKVLARCAAPVVPIR